MSDEATPPVGRTRMTKEGQTTMNENCEKEREELRALKVKNLLDAALKERDLFRETLKSCVADLTRKGKQYDSRREAAPAWIADAISLRIRCEIKLQAQLAALGVDEESERQKTTYQVAGNTFYSGPLG